MRIFLAGCGGVLVAYLMIAGQLWRVGKAYLDEGETEVELRRQRKPKAAFQAATGFAVIFVVCGFMGYAFYFFEVEYPIKRLHAVLMIPHAIYSLNFALKNHATLVAETIVSGLRK